MKRLSYLVNGTEISLSIDEDDIIQLGISSDMGEYLLDESIPLGKDYELIQLLKSIRELSEE